jgi:hypothetical protein
MASSRVFFPLSVAATAVFLAAGFLSTGTGRSVWLALGLSLLVSAGALISSTVRLEAAADRMDSQASFGLDDQRDARGLVVIDTDMRIVASNLAAQRLFKRRFVY